MPMVPRRTIDMAIRIELNVENVQAKRLTRNSLDVSFQWKEEKKKKPDIVS